MTTNNPESVIIRYLYLVPYIKPTGYIQDNKQPKTRKAPYFFDIDIPIAPLDSHTFSYKQTEINITTNIFNDSVLVADCTYKLNFPPTKSTIRHKLATNEYLKSFIQTQYQIPTGAIEEEYLVILIHHVPNPVAFVEENTYKLARLGRSLVERISLEEANEILLSRMSYSERDMVIIDWEGSIILSGPDECEDEIQLLKIANYQLLRYRILDQQIDSQLQNIRHQLNQSTPKFVSSRMSIKAHLMKQLSLMLEFEAIDQQLLLIGDWYTSKLYRTTVKEFYLDDWKLTVQTKLNQLVQIQEMYKNNVAITWSRVMDILQLAGWALLLIGYFVLFFLELNN